MFGLRAACQVLVLMAKGERISREPKELRYRRYCWVVASTVVATCNVASADASLDWRTASSAGSWRSLSDEKLRHVLWDWAREHDSIIHDKILPPNLDTHPNGGMVATGAIKAEEVLVDIPSKLHLSLSLIKNWELAEWVGNITEMALQRPVFATWLSREMDFHSEQKESFWSLYYERLKRVQHHDMPYWQKQERLEVVLPSPEHYLATRAEYWYSHDHKKISNNVPRPILGKFPLAAFINSSMIIGSRAYTTPRNGEVLVPVADLFNHAAIPNAQWTYHPDRDTLHVKAIKDIAPGEEISVSYGMHSNAKLFSTYGFTLEPSTEPYQSFRIWSLMWYQLNREFNVGSLPVDMILTTKALPENFRQFFFEAVAQDHDTIAMLNGTVNHYLQLYEVDISIAPLRKVWAENRKIDSNTSVWWVRLEGCAATSKSPGDEHCDSTSPSASNEDLSIEMAKGSTWMKHVLRVKMSEYVCLVSYAQMMAIYTGTMKPEDTIGPARILFHGLMGFLHAIATGN